MATQFQLILGRKDLRTQSKGFDLMEITVSDIAVTRKDIELARSVVFVDEDGNSLVLKSTRHYPDMPTLTKVVRPFDSGAVWDGTDGDSPVMTYLSGLHTR